MFGIRFVGHPDLRRILMYPEFVGHPLRKDYPVDKRQPLVPERDPIAQPWYPRRRAAAWRAATARSCRRSTRPTAASEIMEIQMGPSHPASHGTIKFNLQARRRDDRRRATSRSATCTAASRRCASRGRGTTCIPYTDRLNYVSPLINNVGFTSRVERLCGIEVPERCQYIRVIVGEISRISTTSPASAWRRSELGADLGRLLHDRGARVPLGPRRGGHRRAPHDHLHPPRRRRRTTCRADIADRIARRVHSTCAACSPTATSC